MAIDREQREVHTVLAQRGGALSFAALGTPLGSARTQRAALAPAGPQLTVANAVAAGRQAQDRQPAASCQQCLTLNFFFDGTGNNLDADVGTMQHSNVARLFLSAIDDDESAGLLSFYVYGIGTYFREIGDAGHTKRGLGMGHMGQARLDWAFRKFDEAVSRAEARAGNPTNKISLIKVNVFGFSRGAALARAFVRDLEARCSRANDEFRLSAGNYPIEVGFLGLFDTVASVGLPMSANNTPGATTAGWYALNTTLNVRAASPQTGVRAIAFGQPGADPAPGDFDGHASWADGLAVSAPAFVKQCVHMAAGQELRNSFPLDSALNGRQYPAGVTEMVYPGAHSNVGGGYQPGEGARSPHYADVLSLVTLRAMHAAAREAGVPLLSLTDLIATGTESEKRSFALDTEGAAKYEDLADHWRHYTTSAGSGGRHVGDEILNHLLWFSRWRFQNIRRNRAAALRGAAGPDAAMAAQRERGFAAERARMERELAPLQAASAAADARASRAEQRLRSAQMAQARTGLPIPAALQSEAAQARQLAQQAKDRFLAEKAKLDTFANDSGLGASFASYDARLMQDMQIIIDQLRSNPALKLRPHYRNLLTAYEDEFTRSRGLSDAKIIAFFDRYVHDSLSGFATDATLPSDPRVVYVGGDNKLRFAGVLDRRAPSTQLG